MAELSVVIGGESVWTVNPTAHRSWRRSVTPCQINVVQRQPWEQVPILVIAQERTAIMLAKIWSFPKQPVSFRVTGVTGNKRKLVTVRRVWMTVAEELRIAMCTMTVQASWTWPKERRYLFIVRGWETQPLKWRDDGGNASRHFCCRENLTGRWEETGGHKETFYSDVYV